MLRRDCLPLNAPAFAGRTTVREPLGSYRSHQANTPVIPGDDRWLCLHPHLLLESPVGYGQDRPTSPLRSIAITATSSLLRATPSQCLASVLRFLWCRHLNGSLRIETTGSRSSIENLDQAHATCTPDTAWAAFRTTPRLLPTVPPSIGFDVMYWFTTSQRWFTCVRLSDPHLPSHARRFPNAHDRHSS